MAKRKHIWIILLLAPANSNLYGGTGRPEDGFLFFIVLLGLLGLILGILQLAEIIKNRIRKFLNRIMEGLIP